MKQILGSCLAALILSQGALAQIRERVYSDPSLPPREALDRMRLVQAWYTVVPVGGRRDGLLSVQVSGPDILVQTRSGIVSRIDAETGRVHWRVLAGKPYENWLPLAYTSSMIFVLKGNDLSALNRKTGDVLWTYSLPGGVSAPPIADELQLYLGMGTTRLLAYAIPTYDFQGRPVTGLGDQLPPAPYSPQSRAALGDGPSYGAELGLGMTSRGKVGVRPYLRWDTLTNLKLDLDPVLTDAAVVVTSSTGDVYGYPKFPREAGRNPELFRLRTRDSIPFPPAQYGNEIYVGSNDATLYAFDVDRGRLKWRYISQTPIAERPVALEKDLFIIARGNGMSKVDRASGDAMWKIPYGNRITEFNSEAIQFVAANPKFVYALDITERLLVIDRKLGTTLSRLNVPGFSIGVANHLTDRIYLAAHNGLIVCLRDRDYPAPFAHRLLLTPQAQLEEKLNTLVTLEPGEPQPFMDLINALKTKYGLKISVSTRAFRDDNREAVLDQKVAIPQVQQRPLREVLKLILDQIQATSVILDDSILIVPAGEPVAPVPPAMP